MVSKNSKNKENKSISLNSTTIEKINAYPNYSYGEKDIPFSYKIEHMVEALYHLTRYSVPELKNYFTVEEAAAICDMENGTGHSLHISPKRSLYFGFQVSCDYEGLDERWGIDKDKLLEKLSNLTEFQAFMVQNLTSIFWDRDSTTFTMKDIADLFYIDFEEEVEA